MTYMKFTGYGLGITVIGVLIVGIENRDGNANVRFHQQDTLERIFSNLEHNDIHVRRARMDRGSYSREIVETVEKHCDHFYIRANRYSSLYDSLLTLRGWKREVINGIEYELNSIIVEKREGKAYRLVIQRERRIDREQDLRPTRLSEHSSVKPQEKLSSCPLRTGYGNSYWIPSRKSQKSYLPMPANCFLSAVIDGNPKFHKLYQMYKLVA